MLNTITIDTDKQLNLIDIKVTKGGKVAVLKASKDRIKQAAMELHEAVKKDYEQQVSLHLTNGEQISFLVSTAKMARVQFPIQETLSTHIEKVNDGIISTTIETRKVEMEPEFEVLRNDVIALATQMFDTVNNTGGK